MTRRASHALVFLTALLLAPALAAAQAPFSVTITPTLNPLPIGLCAEVRLRLVDATGNAARNAAGNWMSLADFDMSVTSRDPRAVVGQQTDEYHWSVCGCQAGVAGAEATITASYPANRLPADARVRGVAFQTTTTFTLAAAIGTVDHTGCGSPPPAAIAAVAPGTPVQAAPSAKTVSQAVGPVAAQQPVPVPIAAGNPRGAPTVGPPPTGVTVTGTLVLARVTWGFVGASSYSVQRWMQNNPNCCRASSPTMGARVTGWDDPLPSTGTYVYRVTAIYADGRQGFVDVNYVAEPTNPAVLTATWKRASWHPGANFNPGWWRHVVWLNWSKVPGAAYYVLWGPGLPLTGLQLNPTVSNNVETHQTGQEVNTGYTTAGNNTWSGVITWTVAAFFLPGPVSTVPADFTKSGGISLPNCGYPGGLGC